MDGSIPFWMYVVGFPLLLGPLVTLHELGHYLVGRWFGVQAEAFSVGFGKELFGRTDRHGTRWKLSALPLGGYVQFKGDMNPSSIPEAGAAATPGTFAAATLWQRALIVFAGPATNLLLTLAIFAGFFMTFGAPAPVDPERTTVIEKVLPGSSAEAAGVRPGDRITAIDGERVSEFADISEKVMMHPGKRIVLSIERASQPIQLPLTIAGVVEKDEFGNASRVGRLGVYSSNIEFRRVGPVDAVALAGTQTWSVVRMMVTGIAQIFSGDRSIAELGGPVKIAKYSGEQLSLGPLAFINFAALISLNLAFINLLPIPGLDGGHLAFYAAEAVRRKPIGPRGQEAAYRAGVALVLTLMIFVTINDLVNLPIFGK